MSKLISASVSDDELIISELARFAVPPPQTCALTRFSLRVYVWLDARDRRSPLGMNVEDLFHPVLEHLISDWGKNVEQLNISLMLAGIFFTMIFNQPIRALQLSCL